MPNMVSNRIFFNDYDEQMDFINSIKPKNAEEDFSFEWLMPIPEDCEDKTEWCWKEWGTKWDACNVYVGIEYLEFETPWNEPVGIYEEMAKKFPDVEFTAYYLYDDESHVGYYNHIPDNTVIEDIEIEQGTDEFDEILREIWNYEYEESEYSD